MDGRRNILKYGFYYLFLRRYKLCSGVAAYYVKSILVCMQCVVQNETELCRSAETYSALHTAYT